MAMTITDHIDPAEEFVPRELHPKPIRLDAIDPDNVVVSFDRRSDTLLIHLFSRGRGSVSVPVSDYLYVMVDPDTEETVGIHVEGFLSQAVKDNPDAVRLLDYAELRGITPAEVRSLQRKVRFEVGSFASPLRSSKGKGIAERRMLAVLSFLRTERLSGKLPLIPVV